MTCWTAISAPRIRRFSSKSLLSLNLAVLLGLTVGVGPQADLLAADVAANAEARLQSSVSYLASDELEGRGIGTKGLDLAADYIAAQFAEMGLKTACFDGQPFQRFTMSVDAELGDSNNLALIGPSIEGRTPEPMMLKLNEDFTPLAIGGSGTIDLPLVFVGYGITSKEAGYDDYAGIDVTGKAVIILRHEPQQSNPHSAFDGTQASEHARFTRKVSNAFEHGAAAVLFCTDEAEIKDKVARRAKTWNESLEKLSAEHAEFSKIEHPTVAQIAAHQARISDLLDAVRSNGEKLSTEVDPVLGFNAAGQGTEGRNFPVLHCRRAVIDQVLRAALNTDLATLEQQIDEGPTPHSSDLAGWRIQGHIDVQRHDATVKNVVAVLEGEGPHADETIVIGAHYDHLGRGGSGSLAPSSSEIHNGADDNGSGTATLLEVARMLAAGPKLPRRIVFIAFTGEERGLIGSARYVREPLVPMEKTIAMLNMDMVGRLADNKLIVYGTGTAKELDSLVDHYGQEYSFDIKKQPEGFGPSDHSSFYALKVPVLHFFTGTHADYHRPSDDTEKLNVEGMRRIGEMVAKIAVDLAEAPDRPQYQATGRGSGRPVAQGDRPYFGSVPDFSQDKPGYVLSSVTKDGPAERSGIKGGDVIIRLGDSKIGNLEDFDSALRKFKAGDTVPVTVLRDGNELKFDVLLEAPR